MTRTADELRELLVHLHSHDLPDEQDRQLAAELAALQSTLATKTRLRWYEGGDLSDNYSKHALYHGDANAVAVPMDISFQPVANGEDGVVGMVTVPRIYEGPPRSVHGGYLSGLFDDVLGGVLRVAGGPGGVTGRLTVRYRAMTPLDTPLRFEAWPIDVRTRRLVARATCHAAGKLTAEAEALFIRVDLADIAEVQP